MRQVTGAIIAAAATILVLNATPANASYTIYAPNATVAGQSIADWTEGWWTWYSEFPAVGNPFDDTMGTLATENNNGPVFYVAGTTGAPTGSVGSPAVRTFSAQAGRPLLFAMSDLAAVQYPVSLENQIASAFYAGTANLVATVDGVPVGNPTSYAETSGVFSMGHAVPGSVGETFETPTFPGDPACPGYTSDLLCPSISMGYWLMMDLSPGTHVITTGGVVTFNLPNDPTYFPGGGPVTIDTEVTDIITVVAAEPGSALLVLPGLLAMSVLRRRLRPTF